MHKYRTYWNTDARIKSGDRYIKIGIDNAAPKPVVTRCGGKVLESFVTDTTEEELLECANLSQALKEVERLCKDAVYQGYRAYLLPVHGNEPPKALNR